MKKRTLVILGLVLSLSLIAAGSALARRGGGYGMMGGGFERGYGACYQGDSELDPEAVAKFQKETLPLRDELITMKLQLRQEYGQDAPDAERIGQLRKGISDLETKIQEVAEEYGVDSPGRRAGRGYGRGDGDCPRGCF